jgi:uncharacterized YceG family protein
MPVFLPPQKKSYSLVLKILHNALFVSVGSIILVGIVAVSYSAYLIRTHQPIVYDTEPEAVTQDIGNTTPQFPVGVRPQEEVIIENPIVTQFFEEHFAEENSELGLGKWLDITIGKLALFNWYQNLASASSRILVIQPGERKEQVVSHFKKILGWTEEEEREFLGLVIDSEPRIEEGKFQPGTYTVSREAKPHDVALLVIARFEENVLARYGQEVDTLVPLEQALIVASLLEREAYDFEDMRHISGVIWNRLFDDMRLQIDATLQYAKGSNPKQPWWPKVVPNDKYIAAVFNTYKHEGLPPSAIANPSAEAILAALNPSETECMFYFHDKKANFHCTKTYEEHVAMLKKYYGRGK